MEQQDMIKRPETTDEVLAVIRDFFERDIAAVQRFTNADPVNVRCSAEARRLWHILTALRGPDHLSPFSPESDALKDATTSLIRQRVFGGIVRQLGCLTPKPDSEKLVAIRSGASTIKWVSHGHFGLHASLAFDALGLKWYKVNGD